VTVTFHLSPGGGRPFHRRFFATATPRGISDFAMDHVGVNSFELKSIQYVVMVER
jgi:hypothetical protein